MTSKPSVSIIIPCRNEEDNVGDCLELILTNDFSTDRLEIFVVDGLSTDHIPGIVARYADGFSSTRLLTGNAHVPAVGEASKLSNFPPRRVNTGSVWGFFVDGHRRINHGPGRA